LDFEEAVELAAKAHRGQRDKVGVVYLLHPLRVALAVSPPARVVAVLHDVIEDTKVTLEELRRRGLGEDELSALALLTKRPEGEADYAGFIARIARADGVAGDLAREVKLADIRDNLGRMPDSDEPDWVRRRDQYRRALANLAG
jgi:hypothetical protein